jgi:ABC-type transport system involved in multi-copper enzyme maturation permease subunit
MLWYKAWIETRARFLVCLAVMLLPVYNFLVWKKLLLPGETDDRFFYLKTLFGYHFGAALIWIFSAILLGLGGLARERAIGSSSLTLTLPVSRMYLVCVRVAVGMFQAMTLAIVPWFSYFCISFFRRTPFSISQAAGCILILLCGGAVYFAASILISSIVEGEYTAAAVAYGLVILAVVLSEHVAMLKGMSPLDLVTGAAYIDKQTSLFSAGLPWATILGCLSVAASMVVLSIAITRWRDF